MLELRVALLLPLEGGGQVVPVDHPVLLAHEHGIFDGVFEFAHIAWPAIALQQCLSLRRKPCLPSGALRVPLVLHVPGSGPLAAAGVLGVMPDLVVSGINAGHNLGVDVTYSGTVACAMEATIKGIPGIAVSTVFPGQSKCDISVARTVAADVACQVAEDVLRHGLPRYTLLNVNVPGVAHADLKGVHVTRMGGRNYQVSELLERSDPYGQPYYWLGGTAPIDVPDDGSDVGAIHNNFVSVTPITLDMTAYALLDEVKSWQIGMPAQANA